MPYNDKERARRLLEAAIKQLTEDSADDASPASRLTVSQVSDSNSPVILIVMEDPRNNPQRDTLSASQSENGTPPPAPTFSGNRETKLSHPGHERFTILESETPASAPKACFIEPARKCVNSGACEMRGF